MEDEDMRYLVVKLSNGRLPETEKQWTKDSELDHSIIGFLSFMITQEEDENVVYISRSTSPIISEIVAWVDTSSRWSSILAKPRAWTNQCSQSSSAILMLGNGTPPEDMKKMRSVPDQEN
ncbi:hypothetical protein D6C83_04208 [Aureobasidium pullulans]|uniref:Uncharacterized protein n=1 Tax=Aureobasidium pullulans TaxID=5580 RepID=A0A4T0D5M4_AURPU|nr:hypothetical protein D6C83_04208 [Aureobasidium pullulans]